MNGSQKGASGVAREAGSAGLSGHLRVTGSRDSVMAKKQQMCLSSGEAPGRSQAMLGVVAGQGENPSRVLVPLELGTEVKARH